MGRLVKYLFYVVVLAAIGLVGYALVSDLPAPREDVEKPVDLELG